MKSRYCLLSIVFSFYACSGNKKSTHDSDSASIYKVWEFKKIDTIQSPATNLGSAWIGKNQIDLRNKDTLRFSYTSTKAHPTAYSYKISHDTIFVQDRASYKILKLTGTELDLAALFKNDVKFVMIYEAR